MKIKLLKLLLEFYGGLLTWNSLSGFGITTDWPNPRYEKQLRRIDRLLKRFLPETYIAHGPEFAAGGAMVVYVWQKNDPRIKKYGEPHFSLSDVPAMDIIVGPSPPDS